MIIDLSGLAGTGKTTLAGKIKKELGGEVHFIGVSSFNTSSRRIYTKIKRVLLLLNLDNLVFLIKAFKIRGNKSGMYSSSVYEEIISYLYLIYIYNNYKKNRKIIVSDEGIIQALVATTVGYEIVKEQLESTKKHIKKRVSNIRYFNCDMSIEDSVNENKKRSRKSAYIDFLSEEKLKEFLYEYNNNLVLVREKIQENEIVVSVDMSKRENEEYILERIRGASVR